ncbi:hypothetical protein MesoLj131c_61690 [Mesorhizobium sp. 131-3-5]|uniref:hypothetical protein n=1 Tax=Mesorhizobium sp. 131-3-5 TaxID=2744520 RepID=UPI00192853EB|nr:hypothetical protein [Mesorhizobium sp. 131-3-5]BCH11911.1 hypothetical protein MesoLj131c_61690 [Mesorhizobium sp. 131-3-5]
MPADRLKVRDAAADGYEVLEDGEPIWSCETIVEAVRFVRDRGARLWLDWDRTIISGRALPFDFSPTFLGSDTVGRIIGEQHGPNAGSWSWSIATHDDRWRKHGGQRGRAATKAEAVAALEREFTAYLANTSPKPSPYAQAKGV